MAFPTLDNPEFPFEEAPEGNTIKSPAEAGYVQTRPRFTRVRRTWRLHWPYLPTAQKNTLMTFFTDTALGGANSFTWTHPITSTVYTVRFAADKLPCRYVAPGYWDITVELEQV